MVRFGVNLNNREPLLANAYTVADLLGLAAEVERLGFDSVWVGDSLFSKPRYEPIALLSAISQRTRHVKLGTACLVSAARNPLYLALEWATLDVVSGGRTILGACMGNPEEGVRREFEALGLDFRRRGQVFEEGLEVLRRLWTEGRVSFHGEFYRYDDIAFYSGTEMGPLRPVQTPPPIWVVSNPRLIPSRLGTSATARVIDRASERIARYGDGWMSCCRARHPEEFQEQRERVEAALGALGRAGDGFSWAYQVTMNLGDSREAAQESLGTYIRTYYPELSKSVDLGEWGPVGTPDDILAWLQAFQAAGVNYFICRFGALDQFDQVRRFARHVLPAFQPAQAAAG